MKYKTIKCKWCGLNVYEFAWVTHRKLNHMYYVRNVKGQLVGKYKGHL